MSDTSLPIPVSKVLVRVTDGFNVLAAVPKMVASSEPISSEHLINAADEIIDLIARLDEFDNELHEHALDMPEATFETYFAWLEEMMRVTVNVGQMLVPSLLSNSSLHEAGVRLDERVQYKLGSLNWDMSEFLQRPEMRELAEEAEREYKAGLTEEGGFAVYEEAM
ncbi:MAG: hypothetical protein O3A46_07255 [Candidatus Poribacteria bacterium]|nr:hypothetical protein [Candidatus Poribacteria bacterium]